MLTGGAIQNAALGAAFLARGKPGPGGPKVTMEHVLQAIRAEFRKTDRPVNETEFKWQPPKALDLRPAPTGEPVAAAD
jgi:hypothetical protein